MTYTWMQWREAPLLTSVASGALPTPTRTAMVMVVMRLGFVADTVVFQCRMDARLRLPGMQYSQLTTKKLRYRHQKTFASLPS